MCCFNTFLDIIQTSQPGEYKIKVCIPTHLEWNASEFDPRLESIQNLELEFQFTKTTKVGLILPSDDRDEFLNLTLDDTKADLNLIQTILGSSSENGRVLARLKKKGEWLLKLAIVISRRLGMKSLELYDASSVLSSERTDMDLKFISLMQYGRSWYQKFGFRPLKENPENMLEWDKIRKTPLHQLQTVFEKIAEDAFWEEYETKMSEFLAFSNPQDKLSQRCRVAFISTTVLEKLLVFDTKEGATQADLTLCDFFAWLAHRDCASWHLLYQFIFGDLVPNNNTWVRGRPYISNLHMRIYQDKKMTPSQMETAITELRLENEDKANFLTYIYIVDGSMCLDDDSFLLGKLAQLDEWKLILHIRTTFLNIGSEYLLPFY